MAVDMVCPPREWEPHRSASRAKAADLLADTERALGSGRRAETLHFDLSSNSISMHSGR